MKVEDMSDEDAIRLYRRKAQEDLGNAVCHWLRENCPQNAFPA